MSYTNAISTMNSK